MPTSAASLSSILASASASPHTDILLTHAWPGAIASFSAVPLPSPPDGAPPVADVVATTRPRYVFTGAGASAGAPPRFWEREPFAWDAEGGEGRVTRFVALGAFGGAPPPPRTGPGPGDPDPHAYTCGASVPTQRRLR